MGSAFAHRWAEKGHQLILCDHSPKKAESLAHETKGKTASMKEAAAHAEVILIAVKPKDLREIQLGELKKEQIVLSILAGVPVHLLKTAIRGGEVIRMMPNLAVKLGEGVLATVAPPEEKLRGRLRTLFEGLGEIFWVEEEKLEAITALAGSGPAYLLAVAEAMVEAGIAMGLSAQEAEALVLQTGLGTLAMLKDKGGHPGQLLWEISSPGGTTIHGMLAFEEQGVRFGIAKALLEAYRRALQMKGEKK